MKTCCSPTLIVQCDVQYDRLQRSKIWLLNTQNAELYEEIEDSNETSFLISGVEPESDPHLSTIREYG